MTGHSDTLDELNKIIPLREKLLAIRRCLADLVAWYTAFVPAAKTDQLPPDWLGSLSVHAQRMLDRWDQHMVEMKVTNF